MYKSLGKLIPYKISSTLPLQGYGAFFAINHLHQFYQLCFKFLAKLQTTFTINLFNSAFFTISGINFLKFRCESKYHSFSIPIDINFTHCICLVSSHSRAKAYLQRKYYWFQAPLSSTLACWK